LLWFYSKTFKRVFLLGNLVVAFTTSLTILVTYLFEANLFRDMDPIAAAANEQILPQVLAYSVFAFLATLIREIIKDIQDIEGDREYGCKTVPVVLGIRTANGIVTFLVVVLIGLLFLAQRYYFTEGMFLKVSYILVVLQLPLAALIFYLIPAQTKEDYGKLSDGMKIIMVLGIASMAVFHYLQ
jgi:4-hydroxybenzoate polyprenyltransferase